MIKTSLLTLVLFFLSTSFAQRKDKGELVGVTSDFVFLDFQSKKIDKNFRKYVEDMVYIPGGTFTFGQSDSDGPILGQSAIATVSGFFMSATEVPNWLYREFYHDMKDSIGVEAAKKYLPDTLSWVRDFPKISEVEMMANMYFWHPAFDQYPVVGVSHTQATLFCDWMSQKVREEFRKSPKTEQWVEMINFQLPTEAEWEYAARGGLTYGVFPWGGYSLTSYGKKRGLYYNANSGAIIDSNKVIIYPSDYDGYEFTAPVKSYEPNEYGLYNMSGNVAEWVRDFYQYGISNSYEDIPTYAKEDPTIPQDSVKRVVKGGSFAESPSQLWIAIRKNHMALTQKSFIGFRITNALYGGNRANSLYH